MPKVFILPGGSPASAAIDMARSMIRTAERRVVALKEQDKLTNLDILRYMNRLGDSSSSSPATRTASYPWRGSRVRGARRVPLPLCGSLGVG